MSDQVHSCPACGQKYDQAKEIERLTAEVTRLKKIEAAAQRVLDNFDAGRGVSVKDIRKALATPSGKQKPHIIPVEGASGPWDKCSECGDELYQHAGDGGVHLQCGQCGHEWYEGEYIEPASVDGRESS